MSYNFKSLLSESDEAKILSYLVEDDALSEIAASFKKVIEELKSMEAVDDGLILVAVDKEKNDLDEDDVLVFNKEILTSKVERDEKLDTITLEDVDLLSGNEALKLIESGFTPVSEATAAYEWEEILGAEVIEENVKRIGAEKFVAIVIKQITFLGFDNDELKEIRATMRAFSEEAKSGKNETFHELKTVEAGPHHLLCGFGLKDKSEQKEIAKIEATKRALKNKIVEYRCIVEALNI